MRKRLIQEKHGIEICINEAREVLVDEFGEIVDTVREKVYIGSASKITQDSEPFVTTLAYIVGNSFEEVFNKIMKEINKWV